MIVRDCSLRAEAVRVAGVVDQEITEAELVEELGPAPLKDRSVEIERVGSGSS
jgi:hypothetical protein